MNKKSISCIILLCALLFCACEKEIEFKGDVKKPVLVLNGYLTPDENVTVHLSKSRFVMDDHTPYVSIENASVELYVNGVLKEKLVYGNEGNYAGQYRPRIGDEIEVRASAPGFEAVKAKTGIPQAPVFELADSTLTHTVKDVSSQFTDDPGYTFKQWEHVNKIRLRLKEERNEENFYFIKAEHNLYDKDKSIGKELQKVELSKVLKGNISDTGNPLEEVLWGEEDSGYKRQLENIFSDALVNGRELFFNFEYYENLKTVMKRPNGNEEIINAGGPFTKEYVIALSSMSPDYYHFVVSAAKSYNVDENPFVEPVQVRTNVENGLGILGAYTTSRFVFRFEKYVEGGYSIQW